MAAAQACKKTPLPPHIDSAPATQRVVAAAAPHAHPTCRRKVDSRFRKEEEFPLALTRDCRTGREAGGGREGEGSKQAGQGSGGEGGHRHCSMPHASQRLVYGMQSVQASTVSWGHGAGAQASNAACDDDSTAPADVT